MVQSRSLATLAAIHYCRVTRHVSWFHGRIWWPKSDEGWQRFRDFGCISVCGLLLCAAEIHDLLVVKKGSGRNRTFSLSGILVFLSFCKARIDKVP
jgi:hypothetical protein